MTASSELAALILTTLSIVALVAGGVKWLTKHYFDEIRAELRPNGGSSLKDQVARLEQKVDIIYDIVINKD